MNPAPAVHLVVRVWLEPAVGKAPIWRGAVIDTKTRDKRFFSTPEALLAHLREATSAAVPSEAAEDGTRDG
jgi:hypothetical protein